jgi:hypothetical protein
VRNERAVNRYEAEVFDAALREQEPVERVARQGFGVNHRENVMLVDRNEFESAAGQDVRQPLEIAREFKLT